MWSSKAKYFIKWWDLLMAMTEKEIKVRYKHAALGFLWMFLQPVLQMAVMGSVFRFFVPVKVDNYFLFLLAGMLPWNFFSYTLLKCIPAYVYERGLIQKSQFPREVVALSIVFSNLFNLIISLLLLLPVVVFFVGMKISILSIFLGLIELVCFTTACSLLFSALNVYYRDIGFVMGLVVPLWFYVTPVMYTLNLLPGKIANIFYLNPMTFVSELFQNGLLGIGFFSFTRGLVSALFSVIFTIVAFLLFRRTSKNFDDWL